MVRSTLALFILAVVVAGTFYCAQAQDSATPDSLTQDALAHARTQYFPDTKNGIHLEMVFNYNVDHPQSEAGVVDMVWGSDYAARPAGVYNTAYIPYSVDNFTNSVEWYQQNHPDWLEYLCDRKTLAFEFGATTLAPIDFANPAVQEYQWATWVDAPLAQGYQGIAVDTMSASSNWGRCGHFDLSGDWVQQYTGRLTDPAYQRDELAWEAATYRHVHRYSKTATMQVNVPYEFGDSLDVNLQMMTTTDLLFDERGFTNYGVAPDLPTPSQWRKIVDVLQYVQSKGVCYSINGEESELTTEIPQEARLWVIANYLLVKNDCTYMYMNGNLANGQQGYGSLAVFPEYSIPIGHATGKMIRAHGVWERKFSGGLALVNPALTDARVVLPPGSYVDVNGNAVGPIVMMGKQSGLVLLKAQ